MWKLVTKEFKRFMRKENITDGRMLDVVGKIEKGLGGERLGASVYWIRFERPNQGQNRGYRSIYVYRQAKRMIFMDGAARRDIDGLNPKERRAIKRLAKDLLDYTEADIQDAIKSKSLQVIKS